MVTPFRRRVEPVVDVLIRGFDNLPLTRRLLASIYKNTPGPAFRVIYVDNGSPVIELADLLADFPDVEAVRLPFNHGSVRAINLGLRLASFSAAPFVLLLDNDTEVPAGDTGWLERWVGYFADEKVAAAGAVSDYVSLFQQAERVPDRYTKAFSAGGRDHPRDPVHQPLLVSFGLMLRKAVVEQVGLFDERFEPGNCEDFDYSLRLAEAGWKNIIAESVWLHHRGSQTFQQFDFPVLLRTNNRLLVEKWGAERLAALGVGVRERRE